MMIRSNAMLVACKYTIRHMLSEISVFENFDNLHLRGYINKFKNKYKTMYCSSTT
jgi:hypothetical protein